MPIRLIGVIDDGSERCPGVPRQPRTPLRLIDGVDETVEIEIVTPSGRPWPLDAANDALTLSFGAARGIGVGKILAKAATIDEGLGPGRADVSISPSDIEQIRGVAGLVYDVRLVQGGVTYAPIPMSPAFVEPGVVA